MFSSAFLNERRNVKYSFGRKMCFSGSFFGAACYLEKIGLLQARGTRSNVPLGLRFVLLTIEKCALCVFTGVFFMNRLLWRDMKRFSDLDLIHRSLIRRLSEIHVFI